MSGAAQVAPSIGAIVWGLPSGGLFYLSASKVRYT